MTGYDLIQEIKETMEHSKVVAVVLDESDYTTLIFGATIPPETITETVENYYGLPLAVGMESKLITIGKGGRVVDVMLG